MPRYTVVDNELLIHHQDEIMKFIIYNVDPQNFLQVTYRNVFHLSAQTVRLVDKIDTFS